MNWKNKVFRNFKLYAVTDLKRFDADERNRVEAAYRGGVDIVQLRSKVLSDREMLKAGLEIKKIALRYKKLFFVNDRPDLALLTGADGVHLGQDDLPVSVVRNFFRKNGRSLWIGKSTHAPQEARQAVKERVDYIGVGPVFRTPTKPHYREVGLDYVRYAAKFLKIPFVAIGGIDASNLDSVINAGARRIAMVRALFGGDTYENSKQIRKQIDSYERP